MLEVIEYLMELDKIVFIQYSITFLIVLIVVASVIDYFIKSIFNGIKFLFGKLKKFS